MRNKNPDATHFLIHNRVHCFGEFSNVQSMAAYFILPYVSVCMTFNLERFVPIGVLPEKVWPDLGASGPISEK